MTNIRLFIIRFCFAFTAFFSWDIVSGSGVGEVAYYYRMALLCALTIQIFYFVKERKTASTDP
jgi:hypothetical protein